ncbi:MAG: pyruvate kinase [Ignavibacteriaceae bacterium]|jgi:pyruvate kinase|nr:pyruvate kinase [Ignavibacteriaceae bacterium]
MAAIAKTKILVTLGPATDTKEKIEALVDAGIDAVRLNMSHGTQENFEQVFDIIHEVCVNKSLPIATLIDLQGPKIRIGKLKEEFCYIISGDTIEITSEDILGDSKRISTSYKELSKDATMGDTILIDDGLINLEVVEVKDGSVVCKIIEGGVLKPRKGMNLPTMKLSTPSLTEVDIKNLEYSLEHRVDYVALSFVRKADDIIELRKYLNKKNSNAQIIAKIEKREAIDNFDEILKASDGIMVARGDLGVELKPQEVPIIQKNIIRRCNAAGKLVITATQMLESMVNNPIPTRAEASDIANAVWDGTDVVMLSAETSVGKFPVEAVKIMNNILISTEADPADRKKIKYEIPEGQLDNVFDAFGKAISKMANQINADLIVIFTHSGGKARVACKYRPSSPIYVFSDRFKTLSQLNLLWGIKSSYMLDISDEEKAVKEAKLTLLKEGIIKKGNLVLFSSDKLIGEKERRSWLRFEII